MIKESDNKSYKEFYKESIKKSDNESIEKTNKESEEEEFIEDLKEAVGLNKKCTANLYDKNNFNKILTTIDSKNFNHKSKIRKLKFNDINNLTNNIKNNTSSETDTKRKINKLNEIKKVETKGKRLIKSQKKLLSLFDDLKTVFNNNNNSNNNESTSNHKNESKNENENENENEKDEYYYEMRQLNNWFETIDQKNHWNRK